MPNFVKLLEVREDLVLRAFYVKFDQIYKKEIADQIENGIGVEVAEKSAPILLDAKKMLLKWEDKDEQVLAMWKMMNEWVYAGFTETYKNLGVDFDKLYYESDT